MKIKVLAVAAALLLMSFTASAFEWENMFDQKGEAAVIDLSGDITPSSSGFGPSGQITPERVRSLTSQARSEGADAIIYEFNSGGGAVVASKEVMRSIDVVDIPTVCRIRDIGASGAYLASLGCDQIVADQVSMTGSIGVTASYMEFTGLMDELGIEYVNISSGEYKEVGTPFQNLTEEDREILQEKSDTVHEHFIQIVDENRNLSDQQLEEATTGEAFLGKEAKELGLVDKLGGRETALETAENLTEQDLQVFQVREAPSFDLLSLISPFGISLSELDISSSAPFRSAF